jgi:hypothetical protein
MRPRRRNLFLSVERPAPTSLTGIYSWCSSLRIERSTNARYHPVRFSHSLAVTTNGGSTRQFQARALARRVDVPRAQGQAPRRPTAVDLAMSGGRHIAARDRTQAARRVRGLTGRPRPWAITTVAVSGWEQDENTPHGQHDVAMVQVPRRPAVLLRWDLALLDRPGRRRRPKFATARCSQSRRPNTMPSSSPFMNTQCRSC